MSEAPAAATTAAASPSVSISVSSTLSPAETVAILKANHIHFKKTVLAQYQTLLEPPSSPPQKVLISAFSATTSLSSSPSLSGLSSPSSPLTELPPAALTVSSVEAALSGDPFRFLTTMITGWNTKIAEASKNLYDHRSSVFSVLNRAELDAYDKLLESAYDYFNEAEDLMNDILVDLRLVDSLKADRDGAAHGDAIEQTMMDSQHCLEICIISCKSLLTSAHDVEFMLASKRSSPALAEIEKDVALLGVGVFGSVLAVAECFGYHPVAWAAGFATGLTTVSSLVKWLVDRVSDTEAKANAELLNKMIVYISDQLVPILVQSRGVFQVMRTALDSPHKQSIPKMKKMIKQVKELCSRGKEGLFRIKDGRADVVADDEDEDPDEEEMEEEEDEDEKNAAFAPGVERVQAVYGPAFGDFC